MLILILDVLELSKNFVIVFFFLWKTVKVENVRNFREICHKLADCEVDLD